MNHARIRERLELRLSQADRKSAEWWLLYWKLGELEVDTHGRTARVNVIACRLAGKRHLRVVR